MDFDTLILNAQKALDQIATSDDFAQLLELGLWDDPAISLSDARQSLDDLHKAYQSMKEEQCSIAQN
jgi:hypothetical protein